MGIKESRRVSEATLVADSSLEGFLRLYQKLGSVRLLAKHLRDCRPEVHERVSYNALEPGKFYIGVGFSTGIRSKPFHLFAFQCPRDGVLAENITIHDLDRGRSGVRLSLSSGSIVAALWDGGCLENRIDGGIRQEKNGLKVYKRRLNFFPCSQEEFEIVVDLILNK